MFFRQPFTRLRPTSHLLNRRPNPNAVFQRHNPLVTAIPNPAIMADTANNSTASTGVTADSLKETLVSKIGAQHVDIEDLSGGCGQAYQAIIVSPQFENKNLLARHRLVNSALKSEIAAIHAWTPKCYTPEQWEKLNQ